MKFSLIYRTIFRKSRKNTEIGQKTLKFDEISCFFRDFSKNSYKTEKISFFFNFFLNDRKMVAISEVRKK